MSARRHERTAARCAAVQMLYTAEIQGKPAWQLLEEGLCPEDIGPISDYAIRLVNGVESHVAELDARLADTSENWAVSRMPIVDRSILRLAAFEMLYVDEVPVSVSINEAVELAKGFGGKDESASFVNGVLGRIARTMGEQVAEEAADEELEEAFEEATSDQAEEAEA